MKNIVKYEKSKELIDSWEDKKKIKAKRELMKQQVSLGHSLLGFMDLIDLVLSLSRS